MIPLRASLRPRGFTSNRRCPRFPRLSALGEGDGGHERGVTAAAERQGEGLRAVARDRPDEIELVEPDPIAEGRPSGSRHAKYTVIWKTRAKNLQDNGLHTFASFEGVVSREARFLTLNRSRGRFSD